MTFLDFVTSVGLATAYFVLGVLPLTGWFEDLNNFHSNTTIEDILNEERKEEYEDRYRLSDS